MRSRTSSHTEAAVSGSGSRDAMRDSARAAEADEPATAGRHMNALLPVEDMFFSQHALQSVDPPGHMLPCVVHSLTG